MNDIAKERTADRILSAIDATKGMTNKEAAECLGINFTYLSHIKRPDNYHHIPEKAWEVMRAFINSGETFEKFKEIRLRSLESSASPASPLSPETSKEEKGSQINEAQQFQLPTKETKRRGRKPGTTVNKPRTLILKDNPGKIVIDRKGKGNIKSLVTMEVFDDYIAIVINK